MDAVEITQGRDTHVPEFVFQVLCARARRGFGPLDRDSMRGLLVRCGLRVQDLLLLSPNPVSLINEDLGTDADHHRVSDMFTRAAQSHLHALDEGRARDAFLARMGAVILQLHAHTPYRTTLEIPHQGAPPADPEADSAPEADSDPEGDSDPEEEDAPTDPEGDSDPEGGSDPEGDSDPEEEDAPTDPEGGSDPEGDSEPEEDSDPEEEDAPLDTDRILSELRASLPELPQVSGAPHFTEPAPPPRPRLQKRPRSRPTLFKLPPHRFEEASVASILAVLEGDLGPFPHFPPPSTPSLPRPAPLRLGRPDTHKSLQAPVLPPLQPLRRANLDAKGRDMDRWLSLPGLIIGTGGAVIGTWLIVEGLVGRNVALALAGMSFVLVGFAFDFVIELVKGLRVKKRQSPLPG